MIKYGVILITSLLLCFSSFAGINKSKKIDIKSYIGQELVSLEQSITSLQEAKDIKILADSNNIITDIFVKTKEINIDSIRVGDKIDKIYEVYPKDWIYTYDKGLMILKGKGSHYGVVTEYIVYISEDQKHISEIQLGYTSPFTRELLPQSQEAANKLLQGRWESKQGRVIEFKNGMITDNVFDKLYKQQNYILIAPNEMIIYRSTNNQCDKAKLKFWVTKDKLYIFTVNNIGLPIRDTVEEFKRIP